MRYLDFTYFQREAIRDLNAKGFKMSRNQLDILFFVFDKTHSTVSEIARELLNTNYTQTLQTIRNLRNQGLLEYFKNSNHKQPNYLFLSEKANNLIKDLQIKVEHSEVK